MLVLGLVVSVFVIFVLELVFGRGRYFGVF
jgi:hypothetical protein